MNAKLRSVLGGIARRIFPFYMGLGSKPHDTLDTAPNKLPDYIIWGVIDWNYRFQRPQHLAQQLAKSGRRAFYISPNFVNRKATGFRVEVIKKNLIYQIFLNLQGSPSIYFRIPTPAELNQLTEDVKSLLRWGKIIDPIYLVHHPFWADLTLLMRQRVIAYDRIDYHEGFHPGSSNDGLVALNCAERLLMDKADITLCSSKWLDDDSALYTPRRLLLRNAADFDFFSTRPSILYEDLNKRRILGYYGAINHWLDIDLIRIIATSFSNCTILLIGHDQCNAKQFFANNPNILMIGEVSYRRLPYYLYSFDVCILPFRKIPLTMATNPVKVYEYLSSGKPVVAVSLPELESLDNLVILARNYDEFILGISKALGEKPNNDQIDSRIRYAAVNSWKDRANVLVQQLEKIHEHKILPQKMCK